MRKCPVVGFTIASPSHTASGPLSRGVASMPRWVACSFIAEYRSLGFRDWPSASRPRGLSLLHMDAKLNLEHQPWRYTSARNGCLCRVGINVPASALTAAARCYTSEHERVCHRTCCDEECCDHPEVAPHRQNPAKTALHRMANSSCRTALSL